jgi:uncharacterized ion transporter superfamily protein YfcC
MSFRLILFIIIQIAGLIFFIENLRRVSKRSAEYRLEENRSTLPFGFVRLRHIVILYVIIYVLWVIFSVFLYSYFIDPSSSLYFNPSNTEIINTTNLNI